MAHKVFKGHREPRGLVDKQATQDRLGSLEILALQGLQEVPEPQGLLGWLVRRVRLVWLDLLVRLDCRVLLVQAVLQV